MTRPFLTTTSLTVIKLVRDYDASRPRSMQTEPGWSEVGGCRSCLGYRLDGAWATDEPDSWAAQRGTAIHNCWKQSSPGSRASAQKSHQLPGHPRSR